MPTTQEDPSLKDVLIDIRRHSLSAIATLEHAGGRTPVSGALRAQMRRLQKVVEELE